MSIETDDTNYADIENIESVEGIIKIGNSGAPSISDLSPNSDWRSFPPSSYNCCYGLPYQDHNYGAPPPPTPPPSPGSNALVTKNKSFEIALKSLKPNKSIPERRTKAPVKRQAIRRRTLGTNSKTTVIKPVADESAPVVVTNNEQQKNGGVLPGDYSDSITRCICNFTHDDGYMICCDQCQVWQHIDCMGIDRSNIPEEYSCEQCMPRRVHKARARLIQKKKRDDILRSSSEDENCNTTQNRTTLLKVAAKECSNKKVAISVKKGIVAGFKKKAAINTIVNSKRQGRKNVTDSMLLSVDGDTDESPWDVPYESATANQYSTDIEESLKSCKAHINNETDSLLDDLKKPICRLRLLANGHRGVEVERFVETDEALIEFKGKVMLQQQFEQENSFQKRPQPFVLFYKNWDHLQICVDATSFGNEARFVRRSCTPNSEVRHVIEKGQIHLLLFATKEITSGSEVTIPFDFDFKSCEYEIECSCVRAQCPVRKANRKVKKRVSQDGEDDSNTPNGKNNTSQKPAAIICATNDKLKIDIPSAGISDKEPMKNKSHGEKHAKTDSLTSPTNEKTGMEEARRLSREDRKIEAYMKAFEKMEKREEKRKELLQKITEKKENPDTPQMPVDSVKETKTQVQAAAPKLRNQSNKTVTNAKSLPQQQSKGMSKTPAARRKRNRSGPALRRRTASCNATSGTASETELDENSNQTANDASSKIPAPGEVGSTATGTISSSEAPFRFPKTKKHLLNEWYNENGLDKCSIEKPLTISVSQNDSIDFVKTNSSPGSTWAHLRRNSASSNSQPTHSSQANTTPLLATRKLDISMGSAKKRWLKQAMEEDSSNQTTPTQLMSPCSESISPPSMLTNNAHSNSTTSTADTTISPNGTLLTVSSHAANFVTPLKKRRVARESVSLDSWPTSPDAITVPDAAQIKLPPLSPPEGHVHAEVNANRETTINGGMDLLLSSHERPSLSKNSSLEVIPETGPNVPPVKNSLLHPTSCKDEMVPNTVRACSPDTKLTLITNEIPTTVRDVGEEFAVSPLKKYKLMQRSQDNSTSNAAVILSPKEPRTLVDLMLQTSADAGTSEANMPCSSLSPVKGLSSPKPPERAISPSKHFSPRKSLLDDNSECDPSTAVRAISLGHTHEIKRSVSLLEDIRHHSSIWNGHEDFGGNRVQGTLNDEPGVAADFAPSTPPCKKKVSLLEYRKRMQVQPPKSDSSTSVSAPTTPLPSREKSMAGLLTAPITLPALPLFTGDKDGEAKSSKRPPMSLDERLKLEFGFASANGVGKSEDIHNSRDRDTPPPPPPPPVLHVKAINSVHTHTANISSSKVVVGDGLINSCPFNMEIDEIVASNGGQAVETNGYSGCRLGGNRDENTSSPQECLNMNTASPRQRGNTLLDSPLPVKNVPLKQGSLGAVMLGQPAASPITNRDISGSRQITQFDLPKKYR